MDVEGQGFGSLWQVFPSIQVEHLNPLHQPGTRQYLLHAVRGNLGRHHHRQVPGGFWEARETLEPSTRLLGCLQNRVQVQLEESGWLLVQGEALSDTVVDLTQQT